MRRMLYAYDRSDGPFPRSRTRKSSVPCHVQKGYQISWLLTSPKLAHDMGSRDASNLSYRVERLPIKPNDFINPNAGSPFQPIPMRIVFLPRRAPHLS